MFSEEEAFSIEPHNDFVRVRAFIAARIKALRQERGLTVQELALRCNMERSNLSRLESGRINMTVLTLYNVCTALEVEMKALFPDSSELEA